MKNNNTLYTINGNKRTFSGVVNPEYKEDKISLFDDYNVNEIELQQAPEGIDLLLFKIMSQYTGHETKKIINRIK